MIKKNYSWSPAFNITATPEQAFLTKKTIMKKLQIQQQIEEIQEQIKSRNYQLAKANDEGKTLYNESDLIDDLIQLDSLLFEKKQELQQCDEV